LQSTPSILPPVIMADEKLQVHDRYYMDDRMIVLSCGGTLFRIPRWHLDKYCPSLLLPEKPDGNTDGAQGTSDDTAIPIGDLISAEEFSIFLDFFYSSIFRKEIPAEEWCRLLAVASKLGCKEVRARAIDELTARKEEVSSIDRIELGNRYDVTKWHPEAYAEIFTRGSHLTTEEGEKLGLEVTVKVLGGRYTCKRNDWTHSGDGNVIQLVKQIFPPPVVPRLAGRAVYTPGRDQAWQSLPRRSGDR